MPCFAFIFLMHLAWFVGAATERQLQRSECFEDITLATEAVLDYFESAITSATSIRSGVCDCWLSPTIA
jgi:hypothetical protein